MANSSMDAPLELLPAETLDMMLDYTDALGQGAAGECGALSVFINNFPELAILHLPTFMKELRSAPSPEGKTLLGAVLAVTRAQEHYALYAKDMLSGFILQPPKIRIVLLIITLHEWGSRDFHKAWIYCGIAIHIMQALHSLRVAPYPLDLTSGRQHDVVSLAIEKRTYWECFIMDCTVNSGTYAEAQGRPPPQRR
ncbi:hypothetical protein TOPH_06921 [Tolypocladium ophioglossoides CBS 100239]|uniref:Transcription factor domain-containing protein n=1 Tax=Tolypocladium ophioglossoides (strain CBS 100239) TaxID=1163406 RepID=A0A0L0N2M4_TOLOC|nr:hypothetical protein TOPH_06921 [Tolypocladium ophioglossoides CBS 100239]